MRMSYAGELGWEFHMPRTVMLNVYHALWSAGERYDIADYGSFAMNILRMEKMFPGAGELTNEVTLPEAGVMRFVRMDKAFAGKTQTQTSLEGDHALGLRLSGNRWRRHCRRSRGVRPSFTMER